MTLTGILQLFIWLFLIPAAAGLLCYNPYKGYERIMFLWVSGQVFLWVVFFLVSVPLIVMEASFTSLVYAYCLAVAFLLLFTIMFCVRGYWKKETQGRLVLVRGNPVKKKFKPEKFYFLLSLILILLQIVLAVVLVYRDGDDSYYVAVAEIAEESDLMYLKNVYTFGYSGLDFRRAIAPFPMWIAFLARISGTKAVITAHVAVSSAQILMGNIVFFLIGGKLFKDRRKHFFIIVSQLLILFADYSIYAPERFLITRSRQGKTTLGAILIPLFFLFFLLLSDYLGNKKKIPAALWGMLAGIQISILLCSTQGAILSGLLAAVLGICAAVVYRRWKLLLAFAASCMPAVTVFLVYLVKKL